jgi:uncharacterized membrane protein YbhN (UPF0104 family)
MSSLPPPAKSTLKRKILTVVQILVTVGILAWVFRDHAQNLQMWEAVTHARPEWLLLGFLSYGLVELLASGRWYLLLRVQGIRLKWWRLGALFMLGIFFNMFMPGGTGGDVLKVFYLIKEIPDKKAKGLLAVLMDRLIGLMALILISGVIIGLRYDWLKTDPHAQKLTWALLLILVTGLGGIVFSFLISMFNLAHKLPQKMPMRDAMIDSSVAYNAYARAWPASLLALFSSFGVHLASFAVFICAARALNVMDGHGNPLPVTDPDHRRAAHQRRRRWSARGGLRLAPRAPVRRLARAGQDALAHRLDALGMLGHDWRCHLPALPPQRARKDDRGRAAGARPRPRDR